MRLEDATAIRRLIQVISRGRPQIAVNLRGGETALGRLLPVQNGYLRLLLGDDVYRGSAMTATVTGATGAGSFSFVASLLGYRRPFVTARMPDRVAYAPLSDHNVVELDAFRGLDPLWMRRARTG